MAGTRHAYVNDQYRVWLENRIDVAGRSIALASKPGVLAHGDLDPSSILLVQHIRPASDSVVIHMNCGNGVLGAALANEGKAARIILTDRNVLAVEAARRTLDANGAAHAEALVGHGANALPSDLKADVVAIRIPQDKTALLQLLHDGHRVLQQDGLCYLAGANDEGAKTAARTMERIFGNATTVATESGHRVVRAIKQSLTPYADAPASPYLDADLFNEQTVELRGEQFTFSSRPGVFSWDHIDEATSILVEHMDVRPSDRVLDLGCGYGVLGTVAGKTATQHPVTMLDVDAEAVRSALRSASAAGLTNARAIVSDIAAAVLEERFDLVITNPPFHVGKSTDLSVPIQFLADAFHVLAPGGRLNLVANRTLPYEGAIRFLFRNLTTVHDGRRFKVLSAVKGA